MQILLIETYDMLTEKGGLVTLVSLMIGTFGQMRLEPEKSSTRDTEPRGRSLEEDAMIYSVECSRDVDET